MSRILPQSPSISAQPIAPNGFVLPHGHKEKKVDDIFRVFP
jgi:hypothetical protein